MESLFGGHDVVLHILDYYKDIVKIEEEDKLDEKIENEWQWEVDRFVGDELKPETKFLQCPSSGRFFYQRNITKWTLENNKGVDEYGHVLLSTLQENALETFVEFAIEEMNTVLDEGDPGDTRAFDIKSTRILEQNKIAVAGAKHYTLLQKMKLELCNKVPKTPTIDAIGAPANEQEAMDEGEESDDDGTFFDGFEFFHIQREEFSNEMLAAMFWSDVNSMVVEEVHPNGLWESSVIRDEVTDEVDYGNLSFYHPRFSSIWSCTVWQPADCVQARD